MDWTDRHETTNFFVQIQQLNRLLTKTAQGWCSAEGSCLASPGGGGDPYNGLYGEAPTERGTFFLLQVYERVGLLLVLFLAERFFSGCSGFPLSPKTVQPFDPQCTDSFKRVLNNFCVLRGRTNYKLQFYLFIFLE